MPEDYGDFDVFEQDGMNIGWVRVLLYTALQAQGEKDDALGH